MAINPNFFTTGQTNGTTNTQTPTLIDAAYNTGDQNGWLMYSNGYTQEVPVTDPRFSQFYYDNTGNSKIWPNVQFPFASNMYPGVYFTNNMGNPGFSNFPLVSSGNPAGNLNAPNVPNPGSFSSVFG